MQMSRFKAKCITFDFCLGSAPYPDGGVYSAPQILRMDL